MKVLQEVILQKSLINSFRLQKVLVALYLNLELVKPIIQTTAYCFLKPQIMPQKVAKSEKNSC